MCGLKWSRDGKYLASGGNDNLLLIWDTNVNSSGDMSSPLFTLTHHQAAVKVFPTKSFMTHHVFVMIYLSLFFFKKHFSMTKDFHVIKPTLSTMIDRLLSFSNYLDFPYKVSRNIFFCFCRLSILSCS